MRKVGGVLGPACCGESWARGTCSGRSRCARGFLRSCGIGVCLVKECSARKEIQQDKIKILDGDCHITNTKNTKQHYFITSPFHQQQVKALGMKSKLVGMESKLVAMESKLVAMESKLIAGGNGDVMK